MVHKGVEVAYQVIALQRAPIEGSRQNRRKDHIPAPGTPPGGGGRGMQTVKCQSVIIQVQVIKDNRKNTVKTQPLCQMETRHGNATVSNAESRNIAHQPTNLPTNQPTN